MHVSDAHLEVLVEPFRENAPGPHVQAAVDALRDAGLDPDMGPFATTADGDVDALADAAAALVRAAFANGASAVQLRVERDS